MPDEGNSDLKKNKNSQNQKKKKKNEKSEFIFKIK